MRWCSPASSLRGIGDGLWRRGPANILVEQARLGIRSAALGIPEYSQDLDLAFERNRQDVARRDRFRRRLDPRGIHANPSLGHELGGERAAFDDARKPKPFVNPLARFCRVIHETTRSAGRRVTMSAPERCEFRYDVSFCWRDS